MGRSPVADVPEESGAGKGEERKKKDKTRQNAEFAALFFFFPLVTQRKATLLLFLLGSVAVHSRRLSVHCLALRYVECK